MAEFSKYWVSLPPDEAAEGSGVSNGEWAGICTPPTAINLNKSKGPPTGGAIEMSQVGCSRKVEGGGWRVYDVGCRV